MEGDRLLEVENPSDIIDGNIDAMSGTGSDAEATISMEIGEDGQPVFTDTAEPEATGPSPSQEDDETMPTGGADPRVRTKHWSDEDYQINKIAKNTGLSLSQAARLYADGQAEQPPVAEPAYSPEAPDLSPLDTQENEILDAIAAQEQALAEAQEEEDFAALSSATLALSDLKADLRQVRSDRASVEAAHQHQVEEFHQSQFDDAEKASFDRAHGDFPELSDTSSEFYQAAEARMAQYPESDPEAPYKAAADVARQMGIAPAYARVKDPMGGEPAPQRRSFSQDAKPAPRRHMPPAQATSRQGSSRAVPLADVIKGLVEGDEKYCQDEQLIDFIGKAYTAKQASQSKASLF